MWGMLLVLTAVRLAVAAYSSLSPDEAYYWLWSRHLDYGFYDHPPMVALWIKAGCWLGGKTALGVRLLAPLAALAGSVFVFFAALDFSGSDRQEKEKNAVTAILMFNATLAIGIGSVTMTPDTPLLFFICVFLWACGRLIVTGDNRWWLVIGMVMGCALLSKYTAILMIAALGIWCFCTSMGRSCLKNGFLWLGGGITCLLFSPVVLWNARHHWVSFVKQGGRTTDWNPHRAIQFLSELFAGQVGLATPLVFLCFCWAFIRLTRFAWRTRRKESLFLWLMIVIPSFVFIQHAFGDRVQANWVGVLYPVLAIVAGIYVKRWVLPAVVLGNMMVLAVYVQTVFACFPVPVKLDMTLKRLGGWENLIREINDRVPVSVPVIVDEYGLASELAFYGIHSRLVSTDKRWRYFFMPEYLEPGDSGKQGYLIRTKRRKDPPPPVYFSCFKKVGELVRQKNGKVIEGYGLYQVHLNGSDENRREIVTLP